MLTTAVAMAVLFRWRKRTDDPESIRQWLLQSWVSVCFAQRLFLKARMHHRNIVYKMLVACHARNGHYHEIAQCALRKTQSLQLFNPCISAHTVWGLCCYNSLVEYKAYITL